MFSSSVYSNADTLSAHFQFLAALKAHTDSIVASKARTGANAISPTHAFLHTLKKRGVLKRVYTQNIDGFEGIGKGALTRFPLEGVVPCDEGVAMETKVKGKGKGKIAEGDYVMLHGGLDMVRCTGCNWVGGWKEEIHGEAFGRGETVDCERCEEKGESIPGESFFFLLTDWDYQPQSTNDSSSTSE